MGRQDDGDIQKFRKGEGESGMTLRCRKGDMAYDLGYDPENYGRICTVGEFLGTRRCVDGIFHDMWEISYGDERINPKTGEKWMESDSALLPIRPGDLGETEETERELTV
jgi:hypothetical protein